MKKYNYKDFDYDDDLIEWLNENQHINVINVSFINTTMTYYKVFYYTEDNISGDDVEYTIKMNKYGK